jgi:hypothetical protein
VTSRTYERWEGELNTYKRFLGGFIVLSAFCGIIHATIFNGTLTAVIVGIIGFHLTAFAIGYFYDQTDSSQSIDNDPWYLQLMAMEVSWYQLKSANEILGFSSQFAAKQTVIAEIKEMLRVCGVTASDENIERIYSIGTSHALATNYRHLRETQEARFSIEEASVLAKQAMCFFTAMNSIEKLTHIEEGLSKVQIARAISPKRREFAIRIAPEVKHILTLFGQYMNSVEMKFLLDSGQVPRPTHSEIVEFVTELASKTAPLNSFLQDEQLLEAWRPLGVVSIRRKVP